MKTQLNLRFILSLTVFAAMISCAQSDDSGGGSTGGGIRDPNKPLGPQNCDQAWAANIRMHPEGRILQYEIKSTSVANGRSTATSHRQIKTTISISNSERLVKRIEIKNLENGVLETPSDEITLKEDFISQCQMLNTNPPERRPESGELPQTKFIGRESLRIGAGTFSALHYEIKFQREFQGITTNMHTDYWNAQNEPTLELKRVTRTQTSAGSHSYTSIEETELIFYKP